MIQQRKEYICECNTKCRKRVHISDEEFFFFSRLPLINGKRVYIQAIDCKSNEEVAFETGRYKIIFFIDPKEASDD